MKKITIFLLSILFSAFAFSVDVISCGDAMSVGNDAKLALHESAQKRAQNEAEELFGQPLLIRYFTMASLNCLSKCPLPKDGTQESTAAIIETFWCESPKTPLHDAYFRFYSRNKILFDKNSWILGNSK